MLIECPKCREVLRPTDGRTEITCGSCGAVLSVPESRTAKPPPVAGTPPPGRSGRSGRAAMSKAEKVGAIMAIAGLPLGLLIGAALQFCVSPEWAARTAVLTGTMGIIIGVLVFCLGRLAVAWKGR